MKRAHRLTIAVFVIAFVLVVAAMLFPLSQIPRGSRDERELRQCKWNLTNLYYALQEYSKDNDGKLPPGAGNGQGQSVTFVEAMSRYVGINYKGKVQALHCPADKRPASESSYVFEQSAAGKSFAALSSAKRILMREDDARHAGKRNVLWSDGSVTLSN